MSNNQCSPGCLAHGGGLRGLRPLPVIDVHAHIALPALELLTEGQPGRLAEIAATVALQGPESTDYNRKTMLPACGRKMTDLAGRLRAMDEMGVDVQVLSPSPGQYHYWADEDLAATIVAMQNEHIATVTNQHPDRFIGLGGVALQHPALAVSQLETAIRHYGLKGVEISTTAGGRELADPALESFWAKAEELGAVVFIHPLGSSLGARLNRSYLANTIGQPIETTIALSHLIFGGVLDRRPGLRIVAAHGGGYLPTYPDRSDHAWAARPDAHSMAHPLSHYLRRIWFDSLVYTPQAIERLIGQVGCDRVVLGTDYPFDMGHYDSEALLAGLTPDQQEAIRGGNALALFGVEASQFRNTRDNQNLGEEKS